MLEDTLSRAIDVYNRYREPMVSATLLETAGRRFRVRFAGPFCTTCCRDDYVDDLRYELDEFGVPAEAITVERLEQTGFERYEATFSVDASLSAEAFD
ncbi:hypothetical protein [Natronobeatus ordinarius]|uniref:hypothetical protein n=1 Tax=Natronobeatus ordinarius TaxID=2963433 RepID=UPI0020CE907A|nr:hypothetical protein [Natronobeatus ordinarius]